MNFGVKKQMKCKMKGNSKVESKTKLPKDGILELGIPNANQKTSSI